MKNIGRLSKITFSLFLLFHSIVSCSQQDSTANNEGELNGGKKLSQSEMAKMDTITLGGGCFWCVEAVYEMLDGVHSVDAGYAGGTTIKPSYKDVCSGKTGHAEVIQIVYDTTVTSFEEILKVFFTVHDPTTLNRQGADAGTQYRSVILYHNEEQKSSAKNIIAALNKEKVYPDPIVTEVSPLTTFYAAEKDHQDYYARNKEAAYCRMVIQPKIEKFEKVFKDKVKE